LQTDADFSGFIVGRMNAGLFNFRFGPIRRQRFRFCNHTPIRPELSSMKWMPACSKAAWILHEVKHADKI
jgi:hypothetical protein